MTSPALPRAARRPRRSHRPEDRQERRAQRRPGGQDRRAGRRGRDPPRSRGRRRRGPSPISRSRSRSSPDPASAAPCSRSLSAGCSSRTREAAPARRAARRRVRGDPDLHAARLPRGDVRQRRPLPRAPPLRHRPRVSPHLAFIVQPHTFSRRRLYQALGVAGVASVSPVYLGMATVEEPGDRQDAQHLRRRHRPGRRLPRAARRRAPGAPDPHPGRGAVRRGLAGPSTARSPQRCAAGQSVSVEVEPPSRSRWRASSSCGTSFGVDGSVLTSDTNFLRIFPSRQRGLIDARPDPPASPAPTPRAVRDALRAALPHDVRGAHARRTSSRASGTTGTPSTPIGYVFTFGVIIGLRGRRASSSTRSSSPTSPTTSPSTPP